MTESPRVIAYIPDLITATRVADALRASALSTDLVDADDWAASVGVGAGAAVVDLAAGPSAGDAVAVAVAAGVPTIAFGPHVDEAALEAARLAGASAVVTRGQLMRDPLAIIEPTLWP